MIGRIIRILFVLLGLAWAGLAVLLIRSLR